MKKMILSWSILICVLVLIGSILFITGQQHDIIIDNTKFEEIEPLENVSYTIDGGSAKKVRKNRKAKVVVKGRGHSMVVEIVDSDGKTQKIEKEIEIYASKTATINITALINDKDKWSEQK